VAVYKREDLKKLELRLATIIAREEYGHPSQYRPSYDLCLYCGRKANCPKLIDFALVVNKKRDSYPELLLSKRMPLTVEECNNDPEVISALKDMANVMEEWATEVQKHALQWSIDNAMDLPGYELKEKRGGRFFQSALLAWREIENLKGKDGKPITGSDGKPLMSVDEFLTTVSRVDFDAFDKLISSRFARGEKGKAVEAISDKLKAEGVLQRYPGAKYLRRLRRGE
jgi:hypothetical protein